MTWVYHSPIGDILIKQLENGRFGMIYDDVIWESCHSPEAEADNVYLHCTSCDEWDRLDGEVTDAPHDLSEWLII